MKRVLIISPFFPPTNAPDMQRVRMSLPYFAEFGWRAEVVTVDQSYSDLIKDELLMESLPADVKIHYVKAFPKGLTSKFGLGSMGLRSVWFYKQKVNQLLKIEKYDLIYFSTTQFPVCVLGAYWKKRFGVSYIIDMQDPWHSEYYQDKPKNERPPKYWFSYNLNKYLEPIAMKDVGGLISVSEKYITDLQQRYPRLKTIPVATITFGAFEEDNNIALNNASNFKSLLNPEFKNLVYIGRGGTDMHKAIKVLFNAFKDGQKMFPDLFKNLKIVFIGTSYAANGSGVPTIFPLAKEMGMEDDVIEITDRISYYHTLITLQQADVLFIPGSDDPKYTASKIYPYLLAKKPLLAIFHRESPALNVLKLCGAEHAYDYQSDAVIINVIDFLKKIATTALEPVNYNAQQLEQFSALRMTEKQCQLFNRTVQQ